MIKILRLLAAMAIVCGFMAGDLAFAQISTAHDYVKDRVIIKYRHGAASSGAATVRSMLQVVHRQPLPLIDAEVLDLSGSTVERAIAQLRNHPEVEYVEPDYMVYADVPASPQITLAKTPNDPRFGDQWGLNNTGQTGGRSDADIDAPEAWDIQTGGSVLVGIIDSGVDWQHPDLSANIWTNPNEIPNNGIDDDNNGYIDDVRGWDFANNDNNPFDDNGHGTHVAGIVAAVGNNGVGVAGVSWSAKIMPLKFLNAAGSGSTSNAILAIDYARIKGARLTNNSWGGGPFSNALRDAIVASSNAGILFVASSGNALNNNDVTPHYPSSYDVDNIIAVAATNDADYMSEFSNYGKLSVDVAAPGSFILSTTPNNTYSYFDGTSQATPMVSGLVSLLWSQNPSWTRQQIRDRIFQTVEPTPGLWDNIATNGRVNAYQALSGNTPEAGVSVSGITETLQPGGQKTVNFSISNTGNSDLKYDIIHTQNSGTPLEVAQPNSLVRDRGSDGVSALKNVDADDGKNKTEGLIKAMENSILAKAPVTHTFSYDITTKANELVALGVEFDGTNIWVTGGGATGSADPNRLFKFDANGNLVATYNQPTTSSFGWRDMAFDGTYLYASETATIAQISRTNGQPTGVTITGPLNPCRALAYDPATDHFWTANFASSIYEFTRAGTVVNTYANTLAIYGMAWDNFTPGGPYLWVWTQDGNGALAAQFDPRTGKYTGLTFDGDSPPGGIAGGLTFTSNHPSAPGLPLLIGLHQSDRDYMTGYLLPPHWITIPAPDGVVKPAASQNIAMTLDAKNLTAGTYKANLLIYTNDPDDNEGLVTVPVNLTVSGGTACTFCGDVNEDNVVNSTDALIILSCELGVACPPNFKAECGDVNVDNVTNSTDALIILTCDVGMPQCPPNVGKPGGCK